MEFRVLCLCLWFEGLEFGVLRPGFEGPEFWGLESFNPRESQTVSVHLQATLVVIHHFHTAIAGCRGPRNT